jgi:hypothetical protein
MVDFTHFDHFTPNPGFYGFLSCIGSLIPSSSLALPVGAFRIRLEVVQGICGLIKIVLKFPGVN